MTTRPLIAVVGDARLSPGDPKYALSQSIGKMLIDEGYRLLTGGMGGVMEAAHRGARSSDSWYDGCSIGLLPGTDLAKANAYVDIVIPTGLDHGRNSVVALVAVGGGAGTLSEIAFAWIHRRLIVALNCEGWSGRLAGERLDGRIRYPELPDDRIYAAQHAADVISVLQRHLPVYTARHSRIA